MFKFQFYIIHYLRINEQNEKVVSFCFLIITLCSCPLHVCKLEKKGHCDKTDDNDVKKTCYHIYKTNKLPLYETFSKILFRYPYSVYKHSIILFFLALDHRVCGEGNECPYPEASCHYDSKKCICLYNLQPSTPDGRCKGK